MATAARKLMTVEEFLDWDDGTDTRHELIDGVPVAMNPPWSFHGTIVVSAGALVREALRDRPPCRAQAEAGVMISSTRYYQADLAVTCAPPRNQGPVEAPSLIVEVLSPHTRDSDEGRKLRDYKVLPTVAEIWLVDSEARAVTVWRRGVEGWANERVADRATFASPVLGTDVELDELYRNTTL